MNSTPLGTGSLPQTAWTAPHHPGADAQGDPATLGLRVAGGGGHILLGVVAASAGSWPAAFVSAAIGTTVAVWSPRVRRAG